jgi:hypothetical protein
MFNTSLTNELDELAEQVAEWRQRHPERYIPRSYWTRSVELAKHYTVNVVAKQVGVDASYLRHKVQREVSDTKSVAAQAKDIQFIELPTHTTKNILGYDHPVTMRMKNPKGLEIEIAFTSGIDELFRFVKQLVLEG